MCVFLPFPPAQSMQQVPQIITLLFGTWDCGQHAHMYVCMYIYRYIDLNSHTYFVLMSGGGRTFWWSRLGP